MEATATAQWKKKIAKNHHITPESIKKTQGMIEDS
jgi:hypothetical protein